MKQYVIQLRQITLQSKNLVTFYFQVLVYLHWYTISILLLSGDIETNPGPVSSNLESLSICHWNLNSIAAENFVKVPAENFVKVPLLEAYVTANKFDIICLSETFLNSTFLNDDLRLSLNGYSLLRADHPSDTKKGGVCIFYKDHLPISLKPNLIILNECLVCEFKAGKKRCFITVLYRSPSQSIEEFSQFKKRWEQTMIYINKHNPYISIFVGDFNARNTNWWDGDINTSLGLDLE